MTGGLKKSASRLALLATAGLIIGGVSAQAADLGGDCCGDLEERVAELEATTVRKGNRKVTLTLSGQVNRTLMYWNDGGRSNTYLGLDNTNSSSRFALTGSAKITPTLSAGFSILVEMSGAGARSATVSQLDEDAGNAGDHGLAARDVNWWIQSSTLGRLTMGRLTQTGPQGTIDVGGIGVVAPGTVLIGSGLIFRHADGTIPAAAARRNIGGLFDATAGYGHRVEGIRWDSPTFAGFTIGLSMGEATKVERSHADNLVNGTTGQGVGRTTGANIRYANDFGALRVAAALGYERVQADEAMAVGRDGTNIGGSLSLMHIPTGLFAQGGYTVLSRTHYTAAGVAEHNERSNKVMHVAAGISQNWFGIGKTSLYGEYGSSKNGTAHFRQDAIDGIGSKATFWGIGVVQNIDAAAMELYAGYRNFSAKTIDADGVTTLNDYKDISVLTAGGRIKF